MAEFPVFPIFTDAYLSDTRHLSAAQHGAYFLLLMTAWRSKSNGLPDDDDRLASWAAMDKRTWLKNKRVVMAFWHKIGDEWHQQRLDDERKRASYVRGRQVQGGLSSALKRKETNSRHLPSEHVAVHQPPSPSPSPSTNLPHSISHNNIFLYDDGASSKIKIYEFDGDNQETIGGNKCVLAADWGIPETWGTEMLGLGILCRDEIVLEGKKFKAYWIDKNEPRTLAVWKKNWRNWCNNEIERKQNGKVLRR